MRLPLRGPTKLHSHYLPAIDMSARLHVQVPRCGHIFVIEKTQLSEKVRMARPSSRSRLKFWILDLICAHDESEGTGTTLCCVVFTGVLVNILANPWLVGWPISVRMGVVAPCRRYQCAKRLSGNKFFGDNFVTPSIPSDYPAQPSGSLNDFATTEQVLAAKNGVSGAIDVLVEAASPGLRRFLSSRLRGDLIADLDDLTQDVLAQCIRKFHTFVPYDDPAANFRNWLITIAVQCLNLRLRTRLRAPKSPTAIEQALVIALQVDSERTPSSAAQWIEVCNDLLSALEHLSPDDCLAMQCRYLMELSDEETAEIMGVTPEATKQRLFRARKKLRENLQQRSSFYRA